MNVSMVQALQPSKTNVGQVSKIGTNHSGFGAVLLQTIGTSNVNEQSPLTNEEANVMAKFQSLLDSLQIEDLSQLEEGKQLEEDLLFATQEEQLLVLFDHVSHIFSAESLEELQKFLSDLASSTEEEQDILQQLMMIVNQVVSGTDSSHQRLVAADDALKLAKVYTLFQNVLVLSDDKASKLDELKQKLEQFAGKLETLLSSKENMNRTALMNSQILNGSTAKIQSILNSNGETKMNAGTMITTGDTSIGNHNPFMNMSKLEQYVLNTQSTDKGTLNSEQLIKSFENIISRVQFTNNNGMQKLLIKLKPEHLGSLRVEIIQQNGTMTAKIIASTTQAKELLDSQMHGLKQAFVNQNIPVEKLELSQQFANLSQDRQLNREQGQQQGEQAGNEQSHHDENVVEEFQIQFEEALLEVEV